ncbi:hypothetical protein [Streptomyces sp. DT117]|uniref:hypothetical protein n=1 Tax=Streptomyces sp. DT117 TaxID=3393422 RepID=UPI003CEA6EE2
MSTLTSPEGLRALPIGALLTDAEGDTARKIGENEYLVTGVGSAVTEAFFVLPVELHS